MEIGAVEKSGLSQTDAAEAVKTLMEVMTDELKTGGTISLTGFGSFSITERAARTGRNPRTGKAIQIPASKVVKFKAGKSLKETVNS
ncbi:MAG: HU family DNA-binding protein [Magnetococcales bacterium]|nr:HU family DNA-binding protein [Magnetococcales bacterium]